MRSSSFPATSISLLGTVNSPFLGYVIRSFVANEIPIDSIILDSKGESPRDLAIHEERTGGRFPPLQLKEFEKYAIPCYFVANHSSSVTSEFIRNQRIDLLINAGTPRIISPAVLQAPRTGIVNWHPGILPYFRGSTCVEWAIFQDKPVGNTIHFMNERIDEGPIVLTESLEFSKLDTYVDIRVKVHERGLQLLANGVKKILNDGLNPSVLEPQGQGRYFPVIDPQTMQDVLKRVERGEYRYQL